MFFEVKILQSKVRLKYCVPKIITINNMLNSDTSEDSVENIEEISSPDKDTDNADKDVSVIKG